MLAGRYPLDQAVSIGRKCCLPVLVKGGLVAVPILERPGRDGNDSDAAVISTACHHETDPDRIPGRNGYGTRVVTLDHAVLPSRIEPDGVLTLDLLGPHRGVWANHLPRCTIHLDGKVTLVQTRPAGRRGDFNRSQGGLDQGVPPAASEADYSIEDDGRCSGAERRHVDLGAAGARRILP